MALDPRISLAAQAPNLQTSIRLFDDIKNSQLKRAVTEQQMKQQAEQFPLMQQQRQQTIDANTQGLRAGEQQQQVDNENRIIQSIAEFTPTLKPLLEQALTSGDTAAAQTALTKRLTGLMNQGLPTNETVDALTALRGGNVQEVIDYLGQNEQIAQQRGLLGNAGQQSRVTSSKILSDGTTIQSIAGGGTKVFSPEGDELSGDERKKAIEGALGVDVKQKVDKAKGVSDVKIDEVLTLENKSQEKQQGIELNKIKIDETKISNEQKRQEAIDQKNIRRKEADAAVERIDNLLKDDIFSKAFGKVVTTTPELLRPQDAIDAIAAVDQVRGLITLESRQKLKGQGTITDTEQKTLAQSASILENPLISDEAARRELRRVKRIFEDASDRNQLKRETKERLGQQQNEFAGFKVIR